MESGVDLLVGESGTVQGRWCRRECRKKKGLGREEESANIGEPSKYITILCTSSSSGGSCGSGRRVSRCSG